MTTSRVVSLALLPALLGAALLAGCGRSAATEAGDLKNFKGENGKMPADFKAKMEAAQRNAPQQAQQQAAQKAAQPPKG